MRLHLHAFAINFPLWASNPKSEPMRPRTLRNIRNKNRLNRRYCIPTVLDAHTVLATATAIREIGKSMFRGTRHITLQRGILEFRKFRMSWICPRTPKTPCPKIGKSRNRNTPFGVSWVTYARRRSKSWVSPGGGAAIWGIGKSRLMGNLLYNFKRGIRKPRKLRPRWICSRTAKNTRSENRELAKSKWRIAN